MNLDDVISLVRALQVTNSDLVKRVTALEAEVVALKQQSSSSTPVAILSAAIHECVQCGAEYSDITNGAGHCSYHPTALKTHGGYSCYLPCCNKDFRGALYESKTWQSALATKGCQRSMHRAKHHTEYAYLGYYAWMRKLVIETKVPSSQLMVWILIPLTPPVA